MIFVIRTDKPRAEEELCMLHERLIREMLCCEGTEHRILCLPSDCTLEIIDDYKMNNEDVSIHMKGIESNES